MKALLITVASTLFVLMLYFASEAQDAQIALQTAEVHLTEADAGAAVARKQAFALAEKLSEQQCDDE